MLQSTKNQSTKLKLLCNQLDQLNLIYQNEPKRSTTTRITPRGLRPRNMEVHKIIYWHKSKTFPPNWKNDHHIFYPSLKEVLLKKQLDEQNLKNHINVGVDYVRRESKKVTTKRREMKLKKLETKQDLLDLVASKASDVKLDYDHYNQVWLSSEDAMKETLRLAHHYEIFRDLFQVKTEKAKQVKKVDLGDLFPRPEQIYETDLEKYYPGAIKFNMNKRDNHYYFNPVLPIYAEFVNKDDELNQVFRGNLIDPAQAFKKPNLVLDTSYFTNQNVDKLYEQLVDESGRVKLTDSKDTHYYAIALLNLDNVFLGSQSVCHYLVANIRGDEQEEIINYLPVYGVKGLGYHRHAFVAFRHEHKLNLDKVNDFDLKKRLFSVVDFMKNNERANLKPVGLNWFQSKWDESCKNVFHNVLKTRMPVYEYIQNKEIKNKQIKFPAPASFNNYLDRYRDPKEIQKEVLIERLNNLDPFDCEKAIADPDLPPNIHKISRDIPSWYKATMWKRNNRWGKFRGLRAPSALRPHNNNEDLDHPKWPHPEKADLPMRYPFERRVIKPLRETKWAIPPEQRPTLFEDEHYNVPERIKDVENEIYKDFKEVLKKND